jgi:hypothetical protein
VQSLSHLIGLDWDMPDFSTLSRRQNTLQEKVRSRRSDGPLRLLAGCTGIKVEGEREWNARKHGGPKRRVSVTIICAATVRGGSRDDALGIALGLGKAGARVRDHRVGAFPVLDEGRGDEVTRCPGIAAVEDGVDEIGDTLPVGLGRGAVGRDGL